MFWKNDRNQLSQNLTQVFLNKKLPPGGIRPHDPLLQSPRWQAETISLDHAARANLT
jgi:hypothetical protein